MSTTDPTTETATDQAAIEAQLAEHAWADWVGTLGGGWTLRCVCHEALGAAVGPLPVAGTAQWSDGNDLHRAHVAAVLAQARAADTGDPETLARVWDEGHSQGCEDATSVPWVGQTYRISPNPYRLRAALTSADHDRSGT